MASTPQTVEQLGHAAEPRHRWLQAALGFIRDRPLGAIGAALILADSGPLAFLGLLAFAVHLGWQVVSVHAGDPAGALRLFRSNREAGLLLFAGLVLDALLR